MQNGNGGVTVGIGEFGSNGMYMLPLGVGREASLGKGCYLIDILSAHIIPPIANRQYQQYEYPHIAFLVA